MAPAGELEESVMVDEAIDHRACSLRVKESPRQFGEGEVCREADTCTLVSSGDDFVEQIGRFTFEWNVTQFVNLC